MKKNQHSYKNLYAVQEPAKRASFRVTGVNAATTVPAAQTIPAKMQRQPYYSAKENDSMGLNKPETRKQFKLYTEPSSEVSPQQNKIVRLEQELKRKICDNGFMAYFRASNSSDYSHIDLYLEMASMQQLMAEQNRLIKKQEKRLEQQQEEINELEKIKQQNQAKFAAHTEQIKKFTDIIDKLQMKMEGEETPQPTQFKTIFQDMQRQKIAACKKVKELEEITMQQEEEIGRLRVEMQQEMKEGAAREAAVRQAAMRQAAIREAALKEATTIKETATSNHLATIDNLKLQIHRHNQQRISLSQQLHLARQQKSSLSSALQKLKRQFRQQQSHNQQLLSRVDQKQQTKLKLQHQMQKKAQYKTLLSDAVTREKRNEQKYQNAKQELKKLEAQRERQVQTLKQQMRDMQRHHKQTNTKKQCQFKITQQEKRKLQNLVGRLQDDLNKAIQKAEKQRQTHRQTVQKLQNANDKLVHQMEKYRLPTAKLKQVCVRLRLILINTGECSNFDNLQLDGIANELMSISQRIVCECIFPLREQLENLSVKLKAAEFEKNNGDGWQLQYLHEAMKVLMKFVPDESDRLVQEYLRLMMDAEKGPENIGRKVSLMEAVLKQAQKARTRPQKQLTRVPSSQYLQERTTRASSCRPPMDSSRKEKINRPNIIKKYFQ